MFKPRQDATASPIDRLPRLSIALASATALAYEILLVRLFSISQWHHFAYMVISLALLGYGASGTFLALARHRLLPRFTLHFALNLLLFAVTLLISYRLADRSAFNIQEILWDPWQLLHLALLYLYLALPFFFVANAIGLSFMHYREQAPQVYGADLLGAGLGSLGIVLVLFMLFPAGTLKLLGALALAAAALGMWELRVRHRQLNLALAGIAVAIALVPTAWLQPHISPYKSLSQTLQIEGTHILEQRSSPLGLISVVASDTIPLRHAPGLSLTATTEPPAQLGIFVDGEGPSAINRVGPDAFPPAYLDLLTWALPYHLVRPGQVLVLGAGGGSEVLQARMLGARQIDAVEVDPNLVSLVRDTYADYSGGLYSAANVNLVTAEARGYIGRSQEAYDLIQVALLDSFSASTAGLHALSESYLYTVESIEACLQRLTPSGYLSITRWIKLPPRDAPKLFATAIEALKRSGIDRPGDHLALIRSWQTSTLLVKRTPFTAWEITALQGFSSERAFDVSYFPGIGTEAINRYNRMPEPYLYQAATALLGPGADRFLDEYKFDLRPATDDRPYFFHFFKWKSLPEIVGLFGQGGIPLIDIGYLILIATLVQAVIASLVLILVPLAVRWRSYGSSGEQGDRRRVFIYFTALGLGFLFLEIAFIQKFILFLHHPVYAVAVVLTAFLLFAGIGSLYSRRLARNGRGAALPVVAIAVLGTLYLYGLDSVFASLSALSDTMRILLSLLMIAPLAFAMGMPFPLGLHRLNHSTPALLPWAWGINGCASVISAVLATLLAMHFGFAWVVIAAMLLYLLAAVSMPR